MALQTLALMQGEGVKPNVISYNRDLPELGSLSWSWRIYQKTWVQTCSTRGHGHIFGFFIPSPVTGGPVGRAFWGHTSETSTLVWWIFWPPTPRNNGWLLRCLSLVLPKMLLYFSYIFSGTLKAWNCRISGTINAVADASQWLKALELFAARQLGIWVGGCMGMHQKMSSGFVPRQLKDSFSKLKASPSLFFL